MVAPVKRLSYQYSAQNGGTTVSCSKGQVNCELLVFERGSWVNTSIYGLKTENASFDGHPIISGHVESATGQKFRVLLSYTDDKTTRRSQQWGIDSPVVCEMFVDGRKRPVCQHTIRQGTGENPVEITASASASSKPFANVPSVNEQLFSWRARNTEEGRQITKAAKGCTSIDDMSSLSFRLSPCDILKVKRGKSDFPASDPSLTPEKSDKYYEPKLGTHERLSHYVHIADAEGDSESEDDFIPDFTITGKPFLEFKLYYKSDELHKKLGINSGLYDRPRRGVPSLQSKVEETFALPLTSVSQSAPKPFLPYQGLFAAALAGDTPTPMSRASSATEPRPRPPLFAPAANRFSSNASPHQSQPLVPGRPSSITSLTHTSSIQGQPSNTGRPALSPSHDNVLSGKRKISSGTPTSDQIETASKKAKLFEKRDPPSPSHASPQLRHDSMDFASLRSPPASPAQSGISDTSLPPVESLYPSAKQTSTTKTPSQHSPSPARGTAFRPGETFMHSPSHFTHGASRKNSTSSTISNLHLPSFARLASISASAGAATQSHTASATSSKPKTPKPAAGNAPSGTSKASPSGPATPDSRPRPKARPSAPASAARSPVAGAPAGASVAATPASTPAKAPVSAVPPSVIAKAKTGPLPVTVQPTPSPSMLLPTPGPEQVQSPIASGSSTPAKAKGPAKTEHTTPKMQSAAKPPSSASEKKPIVQSNVIDLTLDDDDEPAPAPPVKFEVRKDTKPQIKAESSTSMPPTAALLSPTPPGELLGRKEAVIKATAMLEELFGEAEVGNVQALINAGFKSTETFVKRLPLLDPQDRQELFSELAKEMGRIDFGVFKSQFLKKHNIDVGGL